MSRNRSENENTQCHCISSSFLCVSLRLSQIKSAYQFGKSMLHMKFSEKRMKILRDKQWFSQFNFALMTVSSYLNCSTKLAVLKFCCLSIFDANVFSNQRSWTILKFFFTCICCPKANAIQIWQFSDHCVNLLLFCSFRERKLNPTF